MKNNIKIIREAGKVPFVRKTEEVYDSNFVCKLERFVKGLIKKPNPMIVEMYNFKKSTPFEGPFGKIYSYSYDMKKLKKLSEVESDIVDKYCDMSIYSSVDLSDIHVKNGDKYPKLVSFVKKVIKQDKYHDLHGGNIMLDNGNYKLIDLESFFY